MSKSSIARRKQNGNTLMLGNKPRTLNEPMNPIIFFVPGKPRAKQSFKVSSNGGGYTPEYIKDWQKNVGWMAKEAIQKIEDVLFPLEGNLTVTLTFFLGDLRRIDLVNLSKPVEDALNGIAWLDDSQNIALHLEKYVCRTCPGVLVKIEENDRAVEIDEEEMKDIIGLELFEQETEENL